MCDITSDFSHDPPIDDLLGSAVPDQGTKRDGPLYSSRHSFMIHNRQCINCLNSIIGHKS